MKLNMLCKVHVSSESAKRRANGYLTCEVGLPFRPGEPTLLQGERPCWRMPIYLHLHGYEKVAMPAFIEVDAMTRAVIPFTTVQITALQDHAHELATSFISSPPTMLPQRPICTEQGES